MAQRSLVRTQSSKLLKTLLDNPELPTFVERLEAPTLYKLIERIGLEDSGPLIEFTTDRQLRSILGSQAARQPNQLSLRAATY